MAYTVSLNKKYNKLHIYYKEEDLNKSLLNSISDSITKNYFVISISETEDVLNYLNSKVSNIGQPFSFFQLKNITKKDSNNLKANLFITNNKERYIDDIVIKGYENFPKSYLKRFLRIKKGQLFSLEKIRTKTKRLQNIRFANQIKEPEVLFTEDSTKLYLYLEKTKSNTFDGFLGFGTNDKTNKIEFNGYLNLNLINNLNFGEKFSLKYRSDENNQKTFDFNTNLPYILKSPIGIDLNLNIFKKDTIFTTTQQSIKLFYQINSNSKLYAGINSVQSNNLLDNQTNTVQDYSTLFYNTSYELVKPNNSLLFPNNTYIYIEGGIGNRTQENVKQQQAQINLKGYKIISLNEKNSLYLNVDTQMLISNNYLENELKRFGGIKSIRGFEENSLVASLFSVINTEYRYSLSNSIYLHSIIDAAYLENKALKTKDKLYGFGIGFGVLTKTGLLRFNYANGKSENQKFNFSNSKIHISLNAEF